jgi:hypothetical protein
MSSSSELYDLTPRSSTHFTRAPQSIIKSRNHPLKLVIKEDLKPMGLSLLNLNFQNVKITTKSKSLAKGTLNQR